MAFINFKVLALLEHGEKRLRKLYIKKKKRQGRVLLLKLFAAETIGGITRHIVCNKMNSWMIRRR